MGLGNLAAGLYNSPLENLEIQPPQRSRVRLVTNVPAGGQAQQLLIVDPLIVGSVREGDGLILDAVLLNSSASGIGLSILSAQVVVEFHDQLGQAGQLPAAQMLTTGLIIPSPASSISQTFASVFPIILARDLRDMSTQTAAILPAPNYQFPLNLFRLFITLGLNSGAAGALDCTSIVMTKARHVRGMQDG